MERETLDLTNKIKHMDFNTIFTRKVKDVIKSKEHEDMYKKLEDITKLIAEKEKPEEKKRPKVKEPDNFSGDGFQLIDFESHYKRFCMWQRLTDEEAVMMMPFYLNSHALQFYNSLYDEELSSLDSVFTALKSRFSGRIFRLHVMRRIYTEKQK